MIDDSKGVNFHDLKEWSERAARELQAICDEAQESAGDPCGDSECNDLRSLLKQYECIKAGHKLWQNILIKRIGDTIGKIDFGDADS